MHGRVAQDTRFTTTGAHDSKHSPTEPMDGSKLVSWIARRVNAHEANECPGRQFAR